MGRGIADYDNSIMLDTCFNTEGMDVEDIEFALNDLHSELRCTIAHALGDVAIRCEWLNNDLQKIAENDRMAIALKYEDTYTQIIAIPNKYSVYMSEAKADLGDYETTGYGYTNKAGVYIVEALVPYNITAEARRVFRTILHTLGELDEKSGYYKNFRVRSSCWTSAPLSKDAFKQVRNSKGKKAA